MNRKIQTAKRKVLQAIAHLGPRDGRRYQVQRFLDLYEDGVDIAHRYLKFQKLL